MGSASNEIEGAADEVVLGRQSSLQVRQQETMRNRQRGALQEAKVKAQVARGDAREAVKKVVDKARF